MNNENDTQKIVDELELAVMSGEVVSDYDDRYMIGPSWEFCINELAKLDRNLTLNEVFAKVDDDLIDLSMHYSDSTQITAEMLSKLYKVWVDVPALVAREDNVLNWNENDKNVPGDWRKGYQRSLGELIAVHGLVAELVPSYYSWVDYDFQYARRENPVPDKHIAVFNVREDYWHEFNGTFNTDDDSHSGMIADVFYSTGVSRMVRYEGSLSEIMKNLGL